MKSKVEFIIVVSTISEFAIFIFELCSDGFAAIIVDVFIENDFF